MLAEERRQLILELLQQNQRIVAKELADRFQLSVDSIRRDLSIMEEQGLLKKTYGGAIPITKLREQPLPEHIRYAEASPHQDAISHRAASFIQKNDTVFIGGSGIHYGMLKHLPSTFSYTVVTNSLKIAQMIREWTLIDAYLIGGQLRPDSGNIIDSLALEQIGRFSVDIAFLTGGAISGKGISTATPAGAAFARAVSAIARTKIVLAPHEKLGNDMFASSVSIQEFDILITDKKAPPSILQQIASKGVEVIIVQGDRDDDNS